MTKYDVANPGLLRPPVLYLASAFIALGVNMFWPWTFALGMLGKHFGETYLDYQKRVRRWF